MFYKINTLESVFIIDTWDVNVWDGNNIWVKDMWSLIETPEAVVVVNMYLSCREDNGKYLTVFLPGLFPDINSSFIFQHKKKSLFHAAN